VISAQGQEKERKEKGGKKERRIGTGEPPSLVLFAVEPSLES